MDDNEKPDECNSCGWETEALEYHTSGYGDAQKGAWFCEICYGTFAGNAYFRPTRYDGPLLTSVAWIGNFLADKIEKSLHKE